MGSYYIGEKQATQLLSRLTGQSYTPEDMDEFANLGIVPAYIKFKPKDKASYQKNYFQLVQPSIVNEVGLPNLTDVHAQSLMQVLPFPLADCGTLESSMGTLWKAFAAKTDRTLVEVSQAHYERVYAPQEVRLAARNILRSSSPLSIPRICHSCGETWEVERDHDHDACTAWIISPFAGSEAVHVEKRNGKGDDAGSKDRDQPCMRLIIAGMLELIRKAGGESYNKAKVNQELQKLMPKSVYRGMSQKSIDAAFSAATRAKEDAELEAGLPLNGK